MKNLLLAVAVLVAVPVFAQSQPVKVFVAVSKSQQATREISDRLAGRLGTTSRYALTSNEHADILFFVSCLPMNLGDRQVGYACHSNMTYWPVKGVGLFASLEGSMAIGTAADVTEDLFNDFVKDTSDEQLHTLAADLKDRINSAIAHYPHGVE